MLVRTDIPLADQIVQVGHACLEAGWQFAPPAAPCHLVVLGIVSEAHLHMVVADAALAGICCVVFHEPDDGLGATAACSEPIAVAARRVFRRLPLWSTPTALVRVRGPPFPSCQDYTVHRRNKEGEPGDQRPRGKRLSTRAIEQICQDRLGTGKAHVLRHSFARALEDAGAKVSEIQARLGHESLATTGRYLVALRADENPRVKVWARSS